MRRSVSILWLLAGLLALGAAGRLNPRLIEMRRAEKLNQGDPLENAPPLVAFTTVALGGFRGLAVDALWMRATALQDEGKYFEMVQLADWITKLQPRFASIWAFQAWNLSYNISVMFDKPEDRWRWVRHGIGLLRDEGLVYNPGSAQLYRELSWIFLHKVAGDLDNAHLYYKREWAAEMTRVLGGPRPDYTALLAAPATPEALAAQPGADTLFAEVRAAGQNPLDPRWLDPAFGPPDLRAKLEAAPSAAAWRAFLCAGVLRGTHRLEPETMKKVDDAFGPLDWRLPQAQAIYWAYRGMPYARAEFDRLSLDRMVFQAMASAFARGRLTVAADGAVFALSPNLEIMPRVRAVYEKTLAEFPGDETVKTAQMNFLIDAAMVNYQYNREKQAREIFAELRTRYPGDRVPPLFENFIVGVFAAQGESMSTEEAQAAVEGALYQAMFWREVGDADQAAGFEQMARLVWESFMARRTDTQFRERTGLPPLARIQEQALARVRADLEEARKKSASAGAPMSGPRPGKGGR